MRKMFKLWVLTSLVLFAGMVFGQTYSEDFEDGDVTDWHQYRADEEMIQAIDMASAPALLAGGGDKVGYIQDIDASYTGASIVLMGDVGDADYIVEADVYVYENHPQGSAYTGIVAYGDSSKGYYVKLAADFDSNNRFRLYNNQISGFSYTWHYAIDASNVDKTQGWHHMKIQATTNPSDNSSSYHCWYDDVDLGTYVDDTEGHTSSGQAGLYAFQQDSDGIPGYFDNFLVIPSTWTGTKAYKSQPVSMSLKQNYPNPFNPTTTISFDVQEEGNTALQVFNIKGELVKTLAAGQIRSGSYRVTWDGTNAQGQTVPAGSYLIVLNKDNEQLSRSMLMIK